MIPPASERELEQRANALAGRSLTEIARELGAPVPTDLRHAKGWMGELMELALGASAGSRPVPDFEGIGVELKTLPVDRRGQPRESTYVCVVPLTGTAGLDWPGSLVRRKLARVLWMPFEADAGLTVGARRIGTPFLWSPSPEIEAVLRADWEEHMELVALGKLGEIDARLGTYLQIRPKAMNGRGLTRAHDEAGDPGRTLPRGFYLRATFTRRILDEALGRAH
ncbi:MAG: DNA mismatch repair endonuclease MutH [Gammaproteobacteria bacterium]|nr:DNA mismatch repair endonuclease MutH [Gammaproteobacteria bacterium]